jgi:prepilin-type processing-associated H-X9-DG protein
MMFSESPLTTGTPRRSVPTGTYYLYLILPSISPPYYDRPSSRWTGAVRISGDVAVGVENLPVSTDTTEAELNIAFEWGYLSSETSPITQKILSHHPNTVNVGFCDGHQRAMSYTTDVNVFRQLMTPSSEVCLSHYNAQNFWPPNMNPPPPTWLSGQDDRQYGKWGTSGSKYFPPIDGSMY